MHWTRVLQFRIWIFLLFPGVLSTVALMSGSAPSPSADPGRRLRPGHSAHPGGQLQPVPRRRPEHERSSPRYARSGPEGRPVRTGHPPRRRFLEPALPEDRRRRPGISHASHGHATPRPGRDDPGLAGSGSPLDRGHRWNRRQHQEALGLRQAGPSFSARGQRRGLGPQYHRPLRPGAVGTGRPGTVPGSLPSDIDPPPDPGSHRASAHSRGSGRLR